LGQLLTPDKPGFSLEHITPAVALKSPTWASEPAVVG
jgi:hypothetical protein